jgi:PAS domain S-box-containing protein
MVESQPTLEHLKLLGEVSQLLTSLDLDAVMQQVIDLMSNAVGATNASLFLHGEHEVDWDHIFLTRHLDHAESIVVVKTVLDEGLAGWVVRHKQGTIVYDTQTDERWHFFPEDVNPPRSALCVPFLYEDQVLAVLTLAHPEPHHFDDSHLHLMTIVANQAAVAIRTAQLFSQTQAQQRQLEMILRALPEVLLVVSDEGRILQTNDEALRVFGGQEPLTREDIIGQVLNTFPEDRHPGNLLAPARRIIDHPPPEADRWPYDVRDEAHNRDFQVVVTTWADPAQRTGGYIILMHDVTSLRDLHRFKDEMLRVVSHDLRNPVSLINSARDLLETDIPPVEANSLVPKYLEIIQQSTERMETLLSDLLTAETSTQQQIDPLEMIVMVVDQVRPLAERKQQTLEVDVDIESLVGLVGDPLLISEAMENYLSNAIKYTPRKGRITVRAFAQDNQFHFVVEDTGIGIAPEHLSHLFEPYYRPSETIEQGYGIGLSLVKTIVERHRGRVWVKSEKDAGSQFGFWLPL